ncbi:MAG: ABC transporter permease subunit [Planctomycetes bacterium]|nr:ABC transporter permease subunit [Planctomycetota bacterium]
MAETHLEVYRRFEGTLHEHRLRAWPIWTTGLRTALKQRRALLLLYLPPVIATVIFSFVVYLGFMASEQLERESPFEGLGEGDIQERLASGVVMGVVSGGLKMLEVTRQIIEFNKAMGFFALLAVAWFGSGLFCEDRKAGAHQLYFARPITRLDYFLGKFGVAAFFGLCAMLVPPLVICLVASISSPEWAFLKEEWDVIPRAIALAFLWTTVVTLLVLLASSLAARRSFALIGVFGFFMLSGAMSQALGHLVSRRFFALSLGDDLNTLGSQILGRSDAGLPVSPGEAWVAVSVFVAFALVVIAARLRRLEVVA